MSGRRKDHNYNRDEITKILSIYVTNYSYNQTAKYFNMHRNSVMQVVTNPKNKELLEQISLEKRKHFSKDVAKIINKGITLIERRYDTALENQDELEKMIEDIEQNQDEEISYKDKLEAIKKLSKMQLNSLSEITTSIGTLYDKARLEDGETTENQSITIKMSKELEDLSK